MRGSHAERRRRTGVGPCNGPPLVLPGAATFSNKIQTTPQKDVKNKQAQIKKSLKIKTNKNSARRLLML
jgi:hypothetical protein